MAVTVRGSLDPELRWVATTCLSVFIKYVSLNAPGVNKMYPFDVRDASVVTRGRSAPISRNPAQWGSMSTAFGPPNPGAMPPSCGSPQLSETSRVFTIVSSSRINFTAAAVASAMAALSRSAVTCSCGCAGNSGRGCSSLQLVRNPAVRATTTICLASGIE